MPETPLRVGVIGLGGVAVGHLEAYRELSEIRVVAGADPRPDRRDPMASRFGFTPYADHRELLEREHPDVVCVLASVNAHREIVEAAADQGAHVLCEKPLAVRLEDADAMIRRCRDRSVQFFYAASYRFLPPIVTARALIADRRIGEVQLLVETMMGGTGPAGYHDMGAEHYPAGGPGGSGWGLMDHGIHLADIFPWMVGSDIERVCGRGQRSGERPAPEYMTMQLRNGAVGQLLYHDATWSAELPAEGLFSWAPDWYDLVRGEPGGRGARWQEQPGSLRIYGTEGALRVFHYANQLYLRTARGLEQVRVPDRPMPAQFGAEMASFARSLRRGEPPEVPPEAGRRALEAVLAVYESMDRGCWVSLP